MEALKRRGIDLGYKRTLTLYRQFPRLFRYVTADAGIISEENAREVLEAGKHYLFALKQNLKWLYRYALLALAYCGPKQAAR